MNKLLDILKKIFDWIPGKREYYRNKIKAIENEMDILQAEGLDGRNGDKYIALAKLLRNIRKKAENA